ncbi:hypothetical protein TYRP_016820 [Tyrophagus putrescentiae]|nr:hypothetical protein TYRP_016820 [Tyrophagus putrescentiae]
MQLVTCTSPPRKGKAVNEKDFWLSGDPAGDTPLHLSHLSNDRHRVDAAVNGNFRREHFIALDEAVQVLRKEVVHQLHGEGAVKADRLGAGVVIVMFHKGQAVLNAPHCVMHLKMHLFQCDQFLVDVHHHREVKAISGAAAHDLQRELHERGDLTTGHHYVTAIFKNLLHQVVGNYRQ